MEQATLGGGCFWCVEAVYKQVAGIESAVSGYAGGETDNPTYREVCQDDTGHAEVVQLTYEPEVVTYGDILDVFFKVHDPTQEDRQGPDVGSQYRSIILWHNPNQKKTAEDTVSQLESRCVYESGIRTEIKQLERFYRAEEKHQDYFEKHPDQPYCQVNILPKLKTLKRETPEKMAGSSEDEG